MVAAAAVAPDTLEAMAGIAIALEAQGGSAEAEEGLRAVLALSERFLGAEHVDTLVVRERLATLVRGGRSSAVVAGAGVAPGAGRPAAGESQQPVRSLQPVPGLVQEAMAGAPSARWGTISTTAGVLEALWHELPSLSRLQELQLRKVQGLDREACLRLATMALGVPCLRSVDLR